MHSLDPSCTQLKPQGKKLARRTSHVPEPRPDLTNHPQHHQGPCCGPPTAPVGSEVGFAAQRSASAAPTQPRWGLVEWYDRSQNAVRWRCWQRPAGWVPLPMMPHASKARTGCAWGVGGGSSGAASPLAVHREAPRSTCRLPWPRQHGDQAPPNDLSVVDITNPIAIGPCPIATNPQGTSPVAWLLP